MRLIYVLIAYLLAPIVCGVMLWRGLRDRSHWQNFGDRFGFGPGAPVAGSIWVHAVSVGEFNAAIPREAWSADLREQAERYDHSKE